MKRETSQSHRIKNDIRTVLQAAAGHGDLLSIHRSIRASDIVKGVVVGIGDQLMVVNAYSDDVFFNGYTILRLAQIADIEDLSDAFEGKALRVMAEAPNPQAHLRLDSWVSCVESIGTSQLLALYDETRHPDECYVGVTAADRRAIILQEVSTKGEWLDDKSNWDESSITRIDYGGRYETALGLIAGPPPPT